jgi:error-prone DNA polymerase
VNADPSYVELAVTTNFSFLRGASFPQEFVARAAELGYPAIGIADRNSLAGVVRAYDQWNRLDPAARPRLLIGARLVFRDGTPDIIAYPKDRKAYARLCRLISIGKLRAPKGECFLDFSDLEEYRRGLLLIVMPDVRPLPELAAILAILGPDTWLAAAMPHAGEDRRRLAALHRLARKSGVPLIAVNDALYHIPDRRELQDVVTCIREHVSLLQAGTRLQANAERDLKPHSEMARLFRACPEAIDETLRFARRITFSLGVLGQRYPREPVPRDKTPDGYLRELTEAGLKAHFPDGVPPKVAAQAEKELRFIAERKIAHYFLTVRDIVAYARRKGILCQGRGSAANSVVCYALNVTAVDPTKIDVLFERFLSTERREPPDIDVDFEHERREEIVQYIYKRYGHRLG